MSCNSPAQGPLTDAVFAVPRVRTSSNFTPPGRVGTFSCAPWRCAVVTATLGACRRIFGHGFYSKRATRHRQPKLLSCAVSDGSVRANPTSFEFSLRHVAAGLPPSSLRPRVPVWLFRQAGRHLPEYSAYKAARGKHFLQLLRDPEDVAEVTVQPLRRYQVDAAIIFSDILVIAEALGLRVEMPGGKGIIIPAPFKSPADLASLPSLAFADPATFVNERLNHVQAAVRRTLERMREENFGDRSLIGFSAAPWTLLFYMVGGSSRKNIDLGENWLQMHEAGSRKLLDLLTNLIIEHLSAQVRAGCQVLQVFEAMGDHISRINFERWALPAMRLIASELKRRHPGVPLMVFPRGAPYALPALQTAGYDVVSVDTKTDLAAAARSLKEEALRTGGQIATLQGNFDPRWLRIEEGGTASSVQEHVRQMFAALGPVTSFGTDGTPALIANLGEGLSGTESPDLVAVFVDTVHELSSV